jgi:ribonuclease P protein component
MAATKYTLGKTERLKSRKLIEQLFKQGQAFSVFPLRVIYLLHTQAAPPQLQAGFTVSSRHFKKAHDRNRIKRLLREAYRLQKNELQLQLQQTEKKLTVFFVYTGNELPEYKLIYAKTAAALQRLQKASNENSTVHS